MSKHLWILHVLADLDDYSRKNSLTELSEIIQNARRTAIDAIKDCVEEELESRKKYDSIESSALSQKI